jgi:hypothetical protein
MANHRKLTIDLQIKSKEGRAPLPIEVKSYTSISSYGWLDKKRKFYFQLQSKHMIVKLKKKFSQIKTS